MKAILLSDKEIERFDVESWDEASARLYAAECAKETLHLYEDESLIYRGDNNDI